MAEQLDQNNASASFDRADTIYKALGNFEGQAEVSFQRGALYDKVSNLPEARKHLGRALELARTTNNDYQQVKTLQKLGDVEIDAHNVAEGRRLMLEAITLAQSKGIDNLIKRGFVDLANTYLVEGNYPEAEKYVRQSLDLSLQQKDPRNTARARLALASISDRQGNSAQTVSYIEQALPFYQHGAYRKELLQALALLGRANVQQGQYAAATQAFEKELKLAEQYDDQAQAGIAHEDLGLLLSRQGRHPEAVKQLQQSYEIADKLTLKRHKASSLVNLANAHWRLGHYDEARRALSAASSFAEQADSSPNISVPYYVVRSRIALSERNFPEALSHSQKALTLSGTKLKRLAVIATFTNGLAEAMSGSAGGGVKCDQAVNTARTIGDPLLLAESLLTLGEAQAQKNDAAGALRSSLEAQQLAARIGSPEAELTAWLIAARASRALGDLSNAHDYATRADALLHSFEPLWGAAEYNSFLNRPDIQFSRTQLIELLAQK